jgi:hypothetical protein
VSGRVVVEEGGSARSLSRAWPSSSARESFEKVAREAGTLVVAESDLVRDAVLAFSLRLPDDALPNIAARHRAHRLGAARARRSRGFGGNRRPADRAPAGYTAPD